MMIGFRGLILLFIVLIVLIVVFLFFGVDIMSLLGSLPSTSGLPSSGGAAV